MSDPNSPPCPPHHDLLIRSPPLDDLLIRSPPRRSDSNSPAAISKSAPPHHRAFTTSTSAPKKLWQNGDPIVFGAASGTSKKWSKFATVTRGETASLSTTPRTPKGPDDALLQIRKISQDADEYFLQLHREVERMRLERRKKSTAELREALAVIDSISARVGALQKAAERTSTIISRNLAKAVAEEFETAFERFEPVSERTSTFYRDLPKAVAEESETVSEEFESASESPSWVTEEDEFASVKVDEVEVVPEVEENPEPPYIPMTTFTIPQKILEVKKALDDSNVNKWWNHTFYTDPAGKSVKVTYCKTIEDSERALQQFMTDEFVGFDMEWTFPMRSKYSIRQNVALCQIASESSIVLIHIGQMGYNDNGRPIDPKSVPLDETKLAPPTLIKLIESPDILKIGNNATGDHRRLRTYLGVEPKGVFELSDLHNLVTSYEAGITTKIPKRLFALAKQCIAHIGLPLDKEPEVRTSDWSKPVKPAQLKYAAADAYAHLRVFDLLETRRSKLSPRPPRPGCRDIDDHSLDYRPNSKATAEAATTVATKKTELVEEMQTLTSKIDSISEVFSEPINVAAEWMSSYLTSATDGEQPQLSKPQMRAYGLWHHGGLEIGDIARIWRDPPLKGGTVATYILEAIRVGELPYEKERARKAFSMTPSLLKDRFKVLETELYGGAVDGGAVEVEVEEEEKTTVVVVG